MDKTVTESINNTFREHQVRYHNESSDIYSTTLMILVILREYTSPIVACIGIFGNILSCSILLKSKLKAFSSSQYLASLCITNALFLLDDMFVWMNMYNINIYSKPGLCQMMKFVHYSSSFLNNWYFVSFCIDRYICLVWPMEATRMCTKSRARFVIISMLIICTVIHVNMSITYGVETIGVKQLCIPIHHELHNFRLMTIIEISLDIIVPYVFIFILSCFIFQKICMKRRDVYGDDTSSGGLKRLTAVTIIIYILTHMPAELFRVVHTIRVIVSESHIVTKQDPEYYIQAFLQHLFRFGLSLHFIVYLTTYPLFRKYTCEMCTIFFNLITSCKCVERHKFGKYKAPKIEVTQKDSDNEDESPV